MCVVPGLSSGTGQDCGLGASSAAVPGLLGPTCRGDGRMGGVVCSGAVWSAQRGQLALVSLAGHLDCSTGRGDANSYCLRKIDIDCFW